MTSCCKPLPSAQPATGQPQHPRFSQDEGSFTYREQQHQTFQFPLCRFSAAWGRHCPHGRPHADPPVLRAVPTTAGDRRRCRRQGVCGGLPSLAIGSTAVVAGLASSQQAVDMGSGHELGAFTSRLRVGPHVWVRGPSTGRPLPVVTAQRSPGIGRVSNGGVSAFRGAFAALPSGSLALNDVRTPEFVIHEDCRVVAYYAPFDYLNRHATVTWWASHLIQPRC